MLLYAHTVDDQTNKRRSSQRKGYLGWRTRWSRHDNYHANQSMIKEEIPMNWMVQRIKPSRNPYGYRQEYDVHK